MLLISLIAVIAALACIAGAVALGQNARDEEDCLLGRRLNGRDRGK